MQRFFDDFGTELSGLASLMTNQQATTGVFKQVLAPKPGAKLYSYPSPPAQDFPTNFQKGRSHGGFGSNQNHAKLYIVPFDEAPWDSLCFPHTWTFMAM